MAYSGPRFVDAWRAWHNQRARLHRNGRPLPEIDDQPTLDQ